MTGIREMFAEYSGEDLDWFQLAFALERVQDRHRERCRSSWSAIKRDPQRHARVKKQRSSWFRSYYARKKDDPQWREARRKSAREAMQRQRERRKADRSQDSSGPRTFHVERKENT